MGGAPDGDRPLGLRHDNGARRAVDVTARPSAVAGAEQATATAIVAAASEDRGAAVAYRMVVVLTIRISAAATHTTC